MTSNVLITGADVPRKDRGNRGAEQLLATAAARLTSQSLMPVVTVRKVDKVVRRSLALKSYVGNPRLRAFDRVTPSIDLGGFVSIAALDGVLDASGYALGDPWGPHTADWIAKKFEQWSSLGIPIVMLPQAFGPFENADVARSAKKALETCDLIFAREQVSYAHLIDLGIDPGVCRLSPDITLAEKPNLPQKTAARIERLVLVPNWNLSERGDSEGYYNCLLDVSRWASGRGLEVVGLLHEGSKDLAILERLSADTALTIVSDLSGWDVKRYIAQSRVVLSGRYHAVAAALSTETPVVAHSWSHKYQELLNLYKVDWQANPVDSSSTIEKLEALLAAETPVDFRDMQSTVNRDVESAWAEVFSLFERKSSDPRVSGRGR